MSEAQKPSTAASNPNRSAFVRWLSEFVSSAPASPENAELAADPAVLARLAGLRRALGVRTVFNLLGPLTNPAEPPFSLIGAYSAEAAKLMADTLAGMAIGNFFAEFFNASFMGLASSRERFAVAALPGGAALSFSVELR